MEKEMEEVFDRKVREKEKKLSETENELRQKLKEAQEKLDEQREDLEEKIAVFDKVKKIRHVKKFSLEHILPLILNFGSNIKGQECNILLAQKFKIQYK